MLDLSYRAVFYSIEKYLKKDSMPSLYDLWGRILIPPLEVAVSDLVSSAKNTQAGQPGLLPLLDKEKK